MTRPLTSALPAALIGVLVALGMVACGGTPAPTATSSPPERTAPASAPTPRTWLPLDAFYDPPAKLPAKPGALVRSERLTDRLVPAGAQAWRMMYTTTFPDGSPATSVATVIASTKLPAGPRPVIMWEHGTVGIEQKCMPSVVTTPFEGIPALDQVIAHGWVVVATDYAPNAQGVHPYIIGDGEARSGLDSVRAVRHLPGLELDARTVVWGHSQGGHSALWTGIVGPRYAPDVKLAGVAAFAPATDMVRLMTMHGGDTAGGRLGPYLATAYSQYYPGVTFDDAVRPEARAVARKIADLCQFDPKDIPHLNGLLKQLNGKPVLSDPSGGAFGKRLRENTPDRPITVPLLIAQGMSDDVVLPSATELYVEQRCAAGQSLTYWTAPGRDHGGVVAPDTPIEGPLISWTQARFAGAPQASGCQRSTVP